MKLTRIYGYSDDIIIIDGNIEDEFDCLKIKKKGISIICSDGTNAKISYNGDWNIEVIQKGDKFNELVLHDDDIAHVGNAKDASPYSDVLILDVGINYVKIENEIFNTLK